MAAWRKKREIIQRYNQIATSYDTQYAEEQNVKIKVALDDVLLKSDSLILDIGCGTGLLFPHLTEKSKLLIGLDISLNLLRQAKKRAKQYSKTALVQADADHAPFQNQAFHTLFAITLLQNMPDPAVTLKEIGRITKPEATIILTTLKKRFTQKAITELLKKTKLKIITLETTPKIKDHIIICQN